MSPARIYVTMAAFAIGVAIVSFAVGQLAWLAGSLIAAAIALILWGLAAAIAEPEPDQPVNVMWRTTPPFGVERVITPAPSTTELVYAPTQAETFIRGGPDWLRNADRRPVWDTDIFGAPE